MEKLSHIALMFVIAVVLTACQNNSSSSSNQTASIDNSNQTQSIQQVYDTMPEPFGEKQSETGGDENSQYYQPGNSILDNIPSELLRLVEQNEIDNWFQRFGVFPEVPTSLRNYENIYSFIMDFNLTDVDITKGLEAYINNSDPQNGYTDEDMKILLTRDEKQIMEHFASEYSIVNNGKIYSPQWIYTHTTKDYQKEKISSNLISEKLSLYQEIPFTTDAVSALENKINSYSKMALNCDKPAEDTKIPEKESVTTTEKITTTSTTKELDLTTTSQTQTTENESTTTTP